MRKSLLTCVVILFVLCSCREGFDQSDSYKVIKNASDHRVSLVFFNNEVEKEYTLALGDSLVFEGWCISGIGEGCEYSWDGKFYDSATVVFDQAKYLSYVQSDCDGEKNVLNTTELDFVDCGYRIYYVDGLMSHIFEITNEDYESAEPL